MMMVWCHAIDDLSTRGHNQNEMTNQKAQIITIIMLVVRKVYEWHGVKRATEAMAHGRKYITYIQEYILYEEPEFKNKSNKSWTFQGKPANQ